MTVARILMTLHPTWADEIYSGRKRLEFRRVRMKVNPGDRVVICESGRRPRPVTGEFSIAAVHRGTPRQLARLETDKKRAKSVAAYLRGARRGTALRISGPKRYPRARSLASLGISHTPMSYCKL